jgi:hypothetical protein
MGINLKMKMILIQFLKIIQIESSPITHKFILM